MTSTDRVSIDQVLSESNKKRIDKVIEKWLPRSFSIESIEKLCGPARYAYDTQSASKALSDPIWDILDRGGKRWRPVLLLLVAEALGAKEETILDLVVLCEMVHNGSLVVDDIEDDSKLRRGKPCLHIAFPLDVAINAGNAMYFFPLAVLSSFQEKVDPSILVQAYQYYSTEMINLHFGQGFDIWWHQSNVTKVPSEQEYLQMCAYKTGTLARLSAKLSALFSGGSPLQIEALGKFAESIGVAFQIQDDILNLVGEKFGDLKGVGEDIHEGKQTLMVIHALTTLEREDVKKELSHILSLHTEDETLIHRAIDILTQHGSIAYAQKRAKEIIQSAWEDVDAHLPMSDAKKKLQAFADYLIERDL